MAQRWCRIRHVGGREFDVLGSTAIIIAQEIQPVAHIAGPQIDWVFQATSVLFVANNADLLAKVLQRGGGQRWQSSDRARRIQTARPKMVSSKSLVSTSTRDRTKPWHVRRSASSGNIGQLSRGRHSVASRSIRVHRCRPCPSQNDRIEQRDRRGQHRRSIAVLDHQSCVDQIAGKKFTPQVGAHGHSVGWPEICSVHPAYGCPRSLECVGAAVREIRRVAGDAVFAMGNEVQTPCGRLLEQLKAIKQYQYISISFMCQS